MSATFVIVRHGNTFGAGEPPRRIGARTDLPLTETGREQARALGTFFRDQGWHFDRVLSSPLHRTVQTAELVLAALDAPHLIEASDLLAEIDHGPDEDRTEDAVLARIGADAVERWDAEAIAPEGWSVDAAAREAGWKALFAEPGFERTLLVTSNGAARFAFRADPGLQAEAARLASLKLRTGAFGTIAIEESGPRLIDWDRRP